MNTERCRRRGAQFVPIGMPTVCWKTFLAKTKKILSTRNSSILMMSSLEYLFLESECSFTKYVSSCPKTKYLYLRLPFLKMKAFRIILLSLFFNFRWGIWLYNAWKIKKYLMLVTCLKVGDSWYYNNSLEFLRIHIWLIPQFYFMTRYRAEFFRSSEYFLKNFTNIFYVVYGISDHEWISFFNDSLWRFYKFSQTKQIERCKNHSPGV